MHLPKILLRLSAAALAVGSLITAAMATTATVTANDGLRLRAEPNTSAEVITMLPSGTEIEVLDTLDEEWYQVSYGERTGYVSSQYVELAEAAAPKGTVTASILNLREEPNTDSAILARLSAGTVVTFVEAPDGEWYRISYEGIEGYVSSDYIALEGEKYAVVTASSLNIRSAPSTDAEKVGTLANGSEVKILETLDGWLRIEDGYISAEYVSILDGSMTALQAQIVSYAKSFLGCPYIYGATGPRAFDCSGLTNYVYRHFGYTINRGATQQLKNGTTISKSQLQPGDLVFFNSDNPGNTSKATHVGIYIGGGQFVHASSTKVGVVIGDLNSSYYQRVYTTARRII